MNDPIVLPSLPTLTLALFIEDLASTDSKERLLLLDHYYHEQHRHTPLYDVCCEIIYAIPALLRRDDHLILDTVLSRGLLHPHQLMPGSGHSLLQEAVSLHASEECVRTLLRHRVNVEFNLEHERGSALHMAIAQRDVASTELLAQLEPTALSLLDRRGRIPLHLAVHLEHVDVCYALLQHHKFRKSFALILGPLIMAEMIESNAHHSTGALAMFEMFVAAGMDTDSRQALGTRSVFDLVQRVKWADALKYIQALDRALDAEILKKMQE